MVAILRREFSAYFTSAIGYLCLAVFYFFSGFFFFFATLLGDTNSLSGVFSSLFTAFVIFVPLLTMKLMSEDKKLKTDQLLLTSPINLSSLVYGKYFAAVIVLLLGVAITPIYGLVVSAVSQAEWAAIIGSIIGLIFLGSALIAIGVFVSSLTENQVIAAIGSIAIIFILLIIDGITQVINIEWIKNFISSLSFTKRYNEFTSGLFDFSNIIFFLSVIIVFNYLTVRVLEKKRWS